MNLNGEQLIDALCKRLDFQDKRLYDANILSLLRSLDRYELNQLIIFGDIDKWINERNNKKRQLGQSDSTDR